MLRKNKEQLYTLFASLGISVCLLMIIGVLWVIFYNGVEIFWPKEVLSIEDTVKKKKYAGIFVDNRVGQPDYVRNLETKKQAIVTKLNTLYTMKKKLIDDKVPQQKIDKFDSKVTKIKESIVKVDESINFYKNIDEEKYFVANHKYYGFSFKWFTKDNVKVEKGNKNYMIIARQSSSQIIVEPIEFKSATQKFSFQFEETIDKFAKIHEEINDYYNEFRSINVNERENVNSSLRDSKLNLYLAKKDNDIDDIKKYTKLLSETKKQLDSVDEKVERLKKKLAEYTLYVKLPSGEKLEMKLGDILRYDFPNRYSFFGKIKRFFSNVYYFLTAYPYEANTQGGVFPAVLGTLVMTIVMTLCLTPFGVIAAVYLQEYAKDNTFVRFIRICINNLAGVPSIVFGALGLGFFVYIVGSGLDEMFFADHVEFFNEPVLGTGGLLWASLTLALMNIPVVIVATEESLRTITKGVRDAGLACGATKWQVVRTVLLPVATPGIATGVILAMSRAAGEVAPLMLVGVVKSSSSLPIDLSFPFINFSDKFMHLGFHIYDLGFQSPDSEAARPMVYSTTLILITMVLFINSIGIYIRQRLRKKYKVTQF